MHWFLNVKPFESTSITEHQPRNVSESIEIRTEQQRYYLI